MELGCRYRGQRRAEASCFESLVSVLSVQLFRLPVGSASRDDALLAPINRRLRASRRDLRFFRRLRDQWRRRLSLDSSRGSP